MRCSKLALCATLIVPGAPCLAQDSDPAVFGSWSAVYRQDLISDSVLTQSAYAESADGTLRLTLSCSGNEISSASFLIGRVFGGTGSTITLRFDKLPPFALTDWTWEGKRLTESERQTLDNARRSSDAGLRALAGMAATLSSMSQFTLGARGARQLTRRALPRRVLAVDISPTADDLGGALQRQIPLDGLARALHHIHCRP
jgi:hypothetical protein